MRGWLDWYGENALSPSGEFHSCLHEAAGDSALPTPETLLFGSGTSVLGDTRFGEYQLGMAARYSLQVLASKEMRAEALEEATSPDFEQRIADCMQTHGVSYFGRLIMTSDDGNGDGGGSFLTMARYGSLADAQRGTAAVREMLAPECQRWFSSTQTIFGTASRVLEL